MAGFAPTTVIPLGLDVGQVSCHFLIIPTLSSPIIPISKSRAIKHHPLPLIAPVIYECSPHPKTSPHLSTNLAPGLLSRMIHVLILGNPNKHAHDFSNTLSLSPFTSSPPFLLFSTLFPSYFISIHNLSSGPCISLSDHPSLFSDHHVLFFF